MNTSVDNLVKWIPQNQSDTLKLPFSLTELLNSDFDKQDITYFDFGLKREDFKSPSSVFDLNPPPPPVASVFKEIQVVEKTFKSDRLLPQGHFFVFGAMREPQKANDKEVYSSRNPADLIGITKQMTSEINHFLNALKANLPQSNIICEEFRLLQNQSNETITILVIWIVNLTDLAKQALGLKKQVHDCQVKFQENDNIVKDEVNSLRRYNKELNADIQRYRLAIDVKLERFLKVLSTQNLSKKEILSALPQNERRKFEEIYHNLALNLGLIETTIPEKLSSPNQKYRLTELGRKTIRQLNISQRKKRIHVFNNKGRKVE